MLKSLLCINLLPFLAFFLLGSVESIRIGFRDADRFQYNSSATINILLASVNLKDESSILGLRTLLSNAFIRLNVAYDTLVETTERLKEIGQLCLWVEMQETFCNPVKIAHNPQLVKVALTHPTIPYVVNLFRPWTVAGVPLNLRHHLNEENVERIVKYSIRHQAINNASYRQVCDRLLMLKDYLTVVEELWTIDSFIHPSIMGLINLNSYQGFLKHWMQTKDCNSSYRYALLRFAQHAFPKDFPPSLATALKKIPRNTRTELAKDIDLLLALPLDSVNASIFNRIMTKLLSPGNKHFGETLFWMVIDAMLEYAIDNEINLDGFLNVFCKLPEAKQQGMPVLIRRSIFEKMNGDQIKRYSDIFPEMSLSERTLKERFSSWIKNSPFYSSSLEYYRFQMLIEDIKSLIFKGIPFNFQQKDDPLIDKLIEEANVVLIKERSKKRNAARNREILFRSCSLLPYLLLRQRSIDLQLSNRPITTWDQLFNVLAYENRKAIKRFYETMNITRYFTLPEVLKVVDSSFKDG